MTRPRTVESDYFRGMDYGYLWWIIDRKKNSYAAIGNSGNVIYVNPENGEVSLCKTEFYCEEAIPVQPSTMEDGTWRWSKDKVLAFSQLLIGKKVKRGESLVWDIFQKDYFDRNGERRTKAKSIWEEAEINYQNGTVEIKNLLGSGVFDYSKPVFLLERAMEMVNISEGDIILDFFSGSATTAHAVMQLNSEDG